MFSTVRVLPISYMIHHKRVYNIGYITNVFSAFDAYLAINSMKTNMLIGFKTTTNDDILFSLVKFLNIQASTLLKIIFDVSFG